MTGMHRKKEKIQNKDKKRMIRFML